MLELEGAFRMDVAPAQVAAGAAVAVKIPGSVQARLLSVAFRLTTSAAVANRVPRVVATDATATLIGGVVAGIVQAATLVTDWLFTAGASGWTGATGAVISGPAPTLELLPGDTLAITAALLDAGDQFSNVRVVLVAFPIPPDSN